MAPLLSWQVCIGHDSQASVSVDAGTSASAEVRRSSTRILNRLHGLLRDVIPSGVPLDLSATKAAALLRTLRTTATTPPPRPAHRPAAHRHPAPRQRRFTSTLTDDHGLRALLESAANSPTSSTPPPASSPNSSSSPKSSTAQPAVTTSTWPNACATAPRASLAVQFPSQQNRQGTECLRHLAWLTDPDVDHRSPNPDLCPTREGDADRRALIAVVGVLLRIAAVGEARPNPTSRVFRT